MTRLYSIAHVLSSHTKGGVLYQYAHLFVAAKVAGADRLCNDLWNDDFGDFFIKNDQREGDVPAEAVTWYVNSDMTVMFHGNEISEVLVSLTGNNIGVLFTKCALPDVWKLLSIPSLRARFRQ